MNKQTFAFLLLMTAAVVLATAGCAGKHKDDASGAVGQIVDQDIKSEDMGSDGGQIEGLKSVHFEFDKSSLSKEDREILKQDATWMNKHPKQTLQVEGHCDRMGSTEYNLALGQRRADSVKHFLTALGVPGSHLTTISYGKERLLDTAETPEADAKNRRVNFRLVGNLNLKQASK